MFKKLFTLMLCLVIFTPYCTVSAAESIIVSVKDAGAYTETGTWASSSITGYNSIPTRWSREKGATAVFIPELTVAGTYKVYVWKVVHAASDSKQKFEITHNNKTDMQILDFSTGEAGWAEIGSFDFAANGEENVKTMVNEGTARTSAVQFELVNAGGITVDATPVGINNLLVYRPSPQNNTGTFQDIIGLWARLDIEYMIFKSYITGVDNNSFMPDKPVTRAEFIDMIANIMRFNKEPAVTNFSDVPQSAAYSGSVAKAMEAGLFDGIPIFDSKFLPDNTLNREEIDTILENCIKYIKSNYDIAASPHNSFCDRDTISEGTFNPQSTVTRAETAVILKRFLDFIKRVNATALEDYKVTSSYKAKATVDVTAYKRIKSDDLEQTAFDRSIYFNIYDFPGLEPDYLTKWMQYANISSGRGMIALQNMDQASQDPERPGFVLPGDVEERTKRYLPWFKKSLTEFQGKKYSATNGTVPAWMKDKTVADMFKTQAAYDSVADVIDNWLSTLKKNSVAMPSWITCWNEPSWTWDAASLGQYTKTLALKLRENHPEILVGGPGTTYQFPSRSKWGRWNYSEKRFIETAGGVIDCFDYHLYSTNKWSKKDAPAGYSPSLFETQSTENTNYEYGGLDALFDLTEQHQLEAWGGKTKPIVITEMGRQSIAEQFGPWENDFKPWLFMVTTSNYLIQSMNRPEVQLTVPFILRGDAESLRGMALQNHKGLTRFIDFYEFYRELKGYRVPLTIKDDGKSDASSLIGTALLDDKSVYVILHNRKGYPGNGSVKVDLKAMLPEGVSVSKAEVRRMRWQGDVPAEHTDVNPNGILRIDTEYIPLSKYKNLLMTGEETCIVKLTLNDKPEINVMNTEEQYYGDKTLVPLETGKTAQLKITVPKIEGEKVSAKLALGFYRDGGFSSNPIIKVNGKRAKDFDITYSKGYTQHLAVDYINIPVGAVKEGENIITVRFDDDIKGGQPYISTSKLLLTTAGSDLSSLCVKPYVPDRTPLEYRLTDETGGSSEEEPADNREKSIIVIDRGDPGYSEQGEWNETNEITGYNGSATVYAGGGGESVTYKPGLMTPGKYKVSMYKVVSRDYEKTPLEVRILSSGTVDSKTYNLYEGQSGWTEIGTYEFSGNGNEYIMLRCIADFMAGAVTRADAVKLERIQ